MINLTQKYVLLIPNKLAIMTNQTKKENNIIEDKAELARFLFL